MGNRTTEQMLRQLERECGSPLLGYHQSNRAKHERRADYLFGIGMISVVSVIIFAILWAHWPGPPPVPRIENCVLTSGERSIALRDFSEVRTEHDSLLFRNPGGSELWGSAWVAVGVPENHRAAVIEAFVRCRG